MRKRCQSLKQLLHVDNPVNVIGTRHGEKLYETLLTREERAKSEDLGGYFRVSADNRDLNYSLYFSKGVEQTPELEDYNSHNTTRLDVAGMSELLLKLADVRKACASRMPCGDNAAPRRKSCSATVGSGARRSVCLAAEDP